MPIYHQMSGMDGWRGGRPFGWREKAALAVLAIAAVPLALLLITVMLIFAIGAGVVGLAAWAAAKLLMPRRTARPAASVIETKFTRIEDAGVPERGSRSDQADHL